MKIAITTIENSLESEVCQRFGRTPWIMIVDTDSDEPAAIPNATNVEAAQGAGIQTAQKVVGADVAAVLTGHCGPKAFQVLQAAGVEVYVGVTGTAEVAVSQLTAGSLTPAGAADKGQHWS